MNAAIDLINGITGGINFASGILGIPPIPKLGHVNIPMLADGALVKGGRGGVLAGIGEGRYDELVTPLSPKVLAQFNGNDGTSSPNDPTNGQVTFDDESVDRLATTFARELATLLRTQSRMGVA